MLWYGDTKHVLKTMRT